MKIKNRNISDLVPADYNPRQLTEDQYEQIKKSLSTFGFVDPIIINIHSDRKNVIVGGHQRCKVWQDLGNEKVPTVEVNLSLDQERELNIRLNKNYGEWDWDMLANHFEEVELSEFGFSAKELEFLDPDDKDERVSPKINVVHTCPKCKFEFSDKASKEELDTEGGE